MELAPDDSESRAWTTVGHRNPDVRSLANRLVSRSLIHVTHIRFMVDEGSDLYYDSSPLREYEKDAEDEKPAANGSGEGPSIPKQERGSMPPPGHHAQIPLQGVGSTGPDSPQLRRNQMPMPMTPHTPQPSFSPRHPGQFTPDPRGFSQGMPVTPQHQQFFNDPGMRMGMGSPMGGGPMGGMGMHMDGMGMGGMGGMPGMGGMGGMNMGSPDVRRMATRRGPMGMDDGFGGMH